MATSAPSVTKGESDRLPILALIGLFVAGFVGILTEALPAGLLPEMSRTLDRSVALTGQTVTIYAIGTAISVIPLAVATSSWPRRPLLLVALAGLIITNALTALSTDMTLTLVVRFIAGLSSGVIWSLLGAYAARLAPVNKQGRAISIALGGIPVALALGIPAGVFIASRSNWQMAFWASVVLTVATVVWILLTLPNVPGMKRGERPSIARVLRMSGIRTILVVVAAFVIAHNILYTYIAQFLADAGMGEQTGWVLFVFGIMAIISILLVGVHIDRHLRKLVVASTILFAVATLVLVVFSGVPVLVYLAAAAWGLAFGSSATLFTTAVVIAAGPAGDVAQSAMISVFSGSIALGGLFGGLLLGGFGSHSLAWVCFALVVLSAGVAIAAKRHAFPANA